MIVMSSVWADNYLVTDLIFFLILFYLCEVTHLSGQVF